MWIDPRTDEPIPSFDSERQGRLEERRARLAAQARIRELEEQCDGRKAETETPSSEALHEHQPCRLVDEKKATVARAPGCAAARNDDLSPFDQLAGSGMAHYLVVHLGNRETTTFGGNAYVVPEPKWPTEGQRIPDLMVAFDTNPDLYKETNGYVISEQGKPARLHYGSGHAHHRPHGRREQAHGLCIDGHSGILAIRRDGRENISARRSPEIDWSAASMSLSR